MGFLCTGEQTRDQKLQSLTAEVSLEVAKAHCANRSSLIKSDWSYEEIVLAHTVKKQSGEPIPWLQHNSAYWTGAVRVGPTEVKFENGTKGNLWIFTTFSVQWEPIAQYEIRLKVDHYGEYMAHIRKGSNFLCGFVHTVVCPKCFRNGLSKSGNI